MDGCVRIIWQGQQLHGRQTVKARFDTTVPSILEVLSELGKSPDDFNKLLVGEPKASFKKLPCHLFVNGPEVGLIFNKLKEKDLCWAIQQPN